METFEDLIICLNCQKQFPLTTKRDRERGRKYCSRRCFHIYDAVHHVRGVAPRDTCFSCGGPKIKKSTYCSKCRSRNATESVIRRYGSLANRNYIVKYGITSDDVERMKKSQGGLCAVCQKREATEVDHDHRTKKVRGMLCTQCNMSIGLLMDDHLIALRLANYLLGSNFQQFSVPVPGQTVHIHDRATPASSPSP